MSIANLLFWLTILTFASPMRTGRSNVRWFLIFWMFVISAIAFLDRVNISVAGGAIEREYHFDHVQFGAVLSAFGWGYALFQAPCGRLADRFGPRRTLTFGAIWWAVFTALTAAVPSRIAATIVAFAAVRFLLGVGEAVVYPASNRLVASWIPTGERGIANGFIFAGVGAGAGLAPPLVTYVMLAWGWRWSFWISALIGLAAGVVWYEIARDTPEQHAAVAAEEAAHIRAGLPRADQENKKPFSWRAILSNRDVFALTASYFTYGYVAYIFFYWFFLYLSTVRHLNLKSSAYYTMIPFLAMAVCSPLGGWLSDAIAKRFGQWAGRGGLAAAAMLLCAGFIASGNYVHDARLASLVLAGGAGALYLSQSSFWSVSSEMAGPSAGSVSGVMNMGCQIAGALTAFLTPLIAKHYGWAASFFTAAALCAAGALLWLVVDIERGAAKLSRSAAGAQTQFSGAHNA